MALAGAALGLQVSAKALRRNLEDLVEKEVDAGTEEIAGPPTEAPAFLGASLAEASSGARLSLALRRP